MKPEHLAIILKGSCPECKYENNSEEIRFRGSKNHYDFTVACINCNHRFTAHLEVEGSNPKDLVYLDNNQLFQAIHDTVSNNKRQLAGYSFLKEKYPVLFWNLLHHYNRYNCGIFKFRLWQRSHIEKLYGYKVRF